LAIVMELDVPVGVHLSGLGAPGFAKFRSSIGNPARLEDILARHPKLRLYVMHAGWSYLQEMNALLTMHRHVYAEVATINWLIPRPEFHAYLQDLMRCGEILRLTDTPAD
jgi:predicted TIM-barrel fold metal-dependent hydrolase